MRISTSLLCLAFLWVSFAIGADDKDEKDGKKEKTEKIEQQIKTAQVNWDSVEAGPTAVLETKHMVMVAAKPMEKRLKEIGAVLEKAHDQAMGALAFESKQEAYPGKITVYLFPSRDPFKAFVRRVERRRLEGDEAGSFAATDADVHAAASPPLKAVGELSLDGQAAAQVASVLMARRAGTRVPLPDWLIEGFGRATWYRIAPRDRVTLADRSAASRLSSKRSAKEIYDGLVEATEANALRGSLADYVAYGPLSSKLPAFLKGFELEENVESKTTEQALEAATIGWDRLGKGWKTWAISVR